MIATKVATKAQRHEETRSFGVWFLKWLLRTITITGLVCGFGSRFWFVVLVRGFGSWFWFVVLVRVTTNQVYIQNYISSTSITASKFTAPNT